MLRAPPGVLFYARRLPLRVCSENGVDCMTKKIDTDNLYKVRVEPYLELVRMWTRDGISVERQAKALGMSANTLTKMARVHAPLFEALRLTKEIVDLSLVDCLYKRATGYTAVTHQREWVYRYNADGTLRDRRLSKEKEIEQHVPGDPRLLEYWLAHRRPEEWGLVLTDDAGGNHGVVFLPARGDHEQTTDAGGAQPNATDQGPGGVPGSNEDDRLPGQPILYISPENTEETPA